MVPFRSYAIDTDVLVDRSNEDKTHILLIEDSHSDVFLVKRMLHNVSRGEEFEITDVPRMAEALELLDKSSFDIVLLDLHLLDIEGLAAVSALHAEIPNTPIIVYSGTHDPKLREGALMCGARHYLVKGRESAFSLRFMIQQTLSYQAA